MVRLVARHDGLLHDREVAYLARVVALPADRMPVREEEDVIAVSRDRVPAFGASKAVDVPELRSKVDYPSVCRFLIDKLPATAADGLRQLLVQQGSVGCEGFSAAASKA